MFFLLCRTPTVGSRFRFHNIVPIHVRDNARNRHGFVSGLATVSCYTSLNGQAFEHAGLCKGRGARQFLGGGSVAAPLASAVSATPFPWGGTGGALRRGAG